MARPEPEGLIARAIHNRSGRKDRAFVEAQLHRRSSGLLESELLGHERGAFAGAIAQKVGRMELFGGSRLRCFWTKSGISRGLQPKLLRVLQEREFEHLGSTDDESGRRIVAATHRDLEEMISEKQFAATSITA